MSSLAKTMLHMYMLLLSDMFYIKVAAVIMKMNIQL